MVCRSLVVILVAVATAAPVPPKVVLEVDNRAVDVFVPECAHAKSPIILSLHAWATSQSMEEGIDHLPAYAAAGSVCAIVVYPQGKARGSMAGMVGYSWNAGGCCPNANVEKVDDVTFLDHVITAVAEKFNADEQLVLVVGISNGGMMANRLACSNAKVKAFVAVSGQLINGTGNTSEAFSCSRSVPMLHLHGLADPIVPYEGCSGDAKKQPVCSTMAKLPGFPPLPWPTVPDAIADWRGRNGIPADAQGSTTFRNGTTSCESWGSNSNNVTLCSIGGEGHAWPNHCAMVNHLPGMHCTHNIDASAEVIAFFRRYIPAQVTQFVV